jgi:hypothetical protein
MSAMRQIGMEDQSGLRPLRGPLVRAWAGVPRRQGGALGGYRCAAAGLCGASWPAGLPAQYSAHASISARRFAKASDRLYASSIALPTL